MASGKIPNSKRAPRASNKRPDIAPPTAVLLTRGQAAKFLQLSPATLSRWMKERTGPAAMKLDDGPRSPVRYRVADLLEWLDKRIIAPKESS